jgi:hypothetical protein
VVSTVVSSAVVPLNVAVTAGGSHLLQHVLGIIAGLKNSPLRKS